MAKYTIGLASIKVGSILPDGGMGTSLSTLGYTYEDSAKMIQEDPTETEFYAEEVDDPVKVASKPGKITFEWQIMDPDADTLESVFGGSSDGTTWTAPATIESIEQSLEITPEEGLKVSIPRAKLTAKFNSQFSRKGLFMLDMKATVLVPTKNGEPKITIAAI